MSRSRRPRQGIAATISRWVVLTVVLAGGGVPGSAEEAGKDWPQFLGPGRDGKYRGADLARSWPVAGPPVLWRRPVGDGFAGPAVADSKVILFHRVDDEEVVEALDPRDGRVLWRSAAPTPYRDDFGFDEGPRATPVVADGRVFVFGAQGRLRALDLGSGRELWSVDTHRRFAADKGYFGAASSPLVERGRVLVQVGGRQGGIVAFDAATGEVAWTATDDEPGYASPVTAEIGGERLALFFNRSGLVGVAPTSGEVRYRFPWRARIRASVNAASPLVIGDRVFLSASYGVGAVLLDLAGGEPRPVWQAQEAITSHYSTSVHRDGFLYGFHGRQEARPDLRAVSLADGKVAWSERRYGAGSLILAGDRLLVLREDGRLVLVEATPRAYRELARAPVLEPTVRAHPALAGGVLYARDESQLVAVDLRPASP